MECKALSKMVTIIYLRNATEGDFMKKTMKETAWMPRWGDCAALPVFVHPYIYDDDLKASFPGVEWLLENSLRTSCFRDLA